MFKLNSSYKLLFVTSLMSVFVIAFLTFSANVYAHVVVKPDQAGIGAFQTFTMGVPNEKDINVTALRLVIPDGLKYVSPNVKPGWQITTKKDGTDDNAKVTEINWTGGSIPSGQRDDFLFSAQVPSSETTLNWKAYQTYQDGSVASWDAEPTADEVDDDNSNKPGPYSTTKIINDIATASNSNSTTSNQNDNKSLETVSYINTILSVIAIGIAIIALFRINRSSKSHTH